MKNRILTGTLSVIILITSYGWYNSYNMSKRLKTVIEVQTVDVNKKSTKIANLETIITNKDNDLKSKNMVIEGQKIQINKQQQGINSLKKQIQDLKKKQQLIKQQSNFKVEKEGSGGVGRNIGTFEMTSYIAMCREGCTGVTRTGINVKHTTMYQGYHIIATDTSVIPLWSIVKIHTKSGVINAISLDTGGGINGKEIDFLTSTESQANKIGRQNVQIEMVRRGK